MAGLSWACTKIVRHRRVAESMVFLIVGKDSGRGEFITVRPLFTRDPSLSLDFLCSCNQDTLS